MITETKYRTLIWLVIILAVFNVATLTTIFWNTRMRPSFPPNMPREEIQGFMFDSQLNFSTEQKNNIRDLEHAFRESSREIVAKMALNRDEMINELAKDLPSEEKLHELSIELGKYHSELKMQQLQFLKQLKQSCTPEQKVLFQKLLKNVFPTKPPRGYGEQHRRGQGKGYHKKMINN